MSKLQIYSTINKCAWVNERQIALLKTLNGSGNDRIRTHEFSGAPEESTLWWFLSQAESWRLHYHLPGLSCDCWQAHGVYKCQSAGPLRGSHWGFAKKKKMLTEKWQIYERGARKQLSSCHVAICGVDQWTWLYLVWISIRVSWLTHLSGQMCVWLRALPKCLNPERTVAKHAAVTAQTSSTYSTLICFLNPDRSSGWTPNHDLDPCAHTLLHDVKTPDSGRWKLFTLVTQNVPTGSKGRKSENKTVAWILTLIICCPTKISLIRYKSTVCISKL